MENITLILIQRFSADLSPRATFIIYYGLLATLIHVYHGLWLPVRYLVLSREEYYVLWAERKQNDQVEIQSIRVEPRRDYCGQPRQRAARTNITRFSYSRREVVTNMATDSQSGLVPIDI